MKYDKFKVTVIVPVYNEEKTVTRTMEGLKEIMSKGFANYEIVAVNDKSTDSSKELLEKIDGIKILNNPYNLGYSASIKRAMEASDADYIVIIDADGTYPSKDIPKLAEYIGSYDMVIGARIGKNVCIPFMRRPAKFMLNKLANFVSGHKIVDLNSGMRMFDRKKAMRFFNLYPNRFSFTSTITLAFLTNDYTVKYIPIDYYKRSEKSTVKPIRDFLMFINLINRIVLYFKPMRFFFFPGLLFLLAGLGYGIHQVLSINKGLGEAPILLVVVGIQIIFLGLIAEIIVKTRR